MTDDLVKRLRVLSHYMPECGQAADRIEKLETALREIADCVTLPAQNDIEMREIARKALEGKDD
jgi:hypothetical protein